MVVWGLIQAIFVMASIAIGYFVAEKAGHPVTIGALIGGIVGLAVIGIEFALRKASIKGIVTGTVGLILGLVVANLIVLILSFVGLSGNFLLVSFLNMVLGYLGLSIGVRKRDEMDLKIFSRRDSASQLPLGESPKILDTSVIIDGRIADIFKTGFVEGPIIVPRFILKELHYIADSPDPMRKNRGRRGLDMLNRMRKENGSLVKIYDIDFPGVKEVDAKLVRLAKQVGGKIITNDYNLNKVAEIEGIKVLNVNELANAVRPVVLPGEVISVQVIKEGKEHGQGVAYLDDGTMIVIDSGKDYIGQKVDVEVTTVLQTAAGRMIFGRIKGR
jgi:uncharacterized protein YacL